jgi:hypothetical protein
LKLEASSDNVVFQLAVTSDVSTFSTRNVTLRLVDGTFSGTACIAVPTTFSTFYRVQLSAFSYFVSPSSAERAEVLSVYIGSEDAEQIG